MKYFCIVLNIRKNDFLFLRINLFKKINTIFYFYFSEEKINKNKQKKNLKKKKKNK